MPEELLLLQFDEYFRFRAVADLIEGLNRPGLSILDVGSGSSRFLEFLPRHKTLGVDKTKGVDGTKLPYTDRAFDVVTSIDVLEHVPKEDRPQFIQELVRVSRLKVFLAFPYQEATKATAVVNLFTNGWLNEHLEKGLPTMAEVEQVLKKLSVSYTKHPNLPLDLWVAMTIADWYAPDELKRPLNREFNRNFYRKPAPGVPCYRLIYEITPKRQVAGRSIKVWANPSSLHQR